MLLNDVPNTWVSQHYQVQIGPIQRHSAMGDASLHVHCVYVKRKRLRLAICDRSVFSKSKYADLTNV